MKIFQVLISLICLSTAILLRASRAGPLFHASAQNNQREEENKHRRIEQKYWLASTIISGLALTSTIAAACFAYGAYQEAKRQAYVAQQALEASTRPWVLIETITAASPLILDNGKISISVKARVKNHAQLPALGALFVAKIVQVKPGFTYPMMEAKKFCHDYRDDFTYSATVFSAGASVETNTISTETVITNDYFYPPDSGRPFLQLTMVGCLNYSGLDGQRHQTVSFHSVTDEESYTSFDPSGFTIQSNKISFANELMFSNDER